MNFHQYKRQTEFRELENDYHRTDLLWLIKK